MSDFSLTAAGRIDSDVTKQDARREQVGRLFETLFIQQLLKRDQPFADDERSRFLDESPGERSAKELLNQAIGEQAAGSFGIDDLLSDRLNVLAQRRPGS